MVVWSLGDHGDVPERLTRMFEFFLEDLIPLGMVWEAGHAHGASVWISPDGVAAWEEAQIEDDRMSALTLDGGRRNTAFWQWVESKLPTEPYWHLDSVAVEPEARGLGLGAALIEHGLVRARADGAPARLETGNPRNVGYYERFGFVIEEEAQSPDGGPIVWFMLNEP